MDFAACLPFTSDMAELVTVALQRLERVSVWKEDRPSPGVDNAFAVIHRDWNGWRNALVRVADLEEIRWVQPPGAPRPMIHAHVNCTNIRSGDLQHECEQRSAPHRLFVCVLKSHCAPLVFAELSRRAAER